MMGDGGGKFSVKSEKIKVKSFICLPLSFVTQKARKSRKFFFLISHGNLFSYFLSNFSL